MRAPLVSRLVAHTLVNAFRPFVDREWNFALPSTAIAFGYIATLESAPWLRHLAIANICALLGFVYWRWALNCARRLGDAAAPFESEGDVSQSDSDNPAARAAAFEDRIDAAIARSGRFSRHVGLVSLWWAPGVDVDGDADLDALRDTLVASLDSRCVAHFVDEDRAWVMVKGLRSFGDLQAVQKGLVELLVRQTDTPLRTVAAGCAMAPMHGYDASSLIEFADENQEHQIRVHPFKTFARQLGRALPAAPAGANQRLAG